MRFNKQADNSKWWAKANELETGKIYCTANLKELKERENQKFKLYRETNERKNIVVIVF